MMLETAASTELCVKEHEPFHSLQQHPPKKDYVRAVSLLTGYLIQSNGPSSCTLYYLTQVDPKGEVTLYPLTVVDL